MKIAEIDLKLKHARQTLNQTVNEIISYIKNLKTQLSKLSKKYQEYSNLFHALHSHLKKTMLKIVSKIFQEKSLKSLLDDSSTRRFSSKKMTNFENLILKESKIIHFFIDNSSMSKMMTVCRIRSIEAIIEIKVKMVNIAKIDVVKTKFRAIKQRNLKIIISLIYQR